MPKQAEDEAAAKRTARALRDALAAEEGHRQQIARRERWAKEAMYLTREEAASGTACRGCGLPVIDGLGDWPPPMKLNARRAAGVRAVRSGVQDTSRGVSRPPLERVWLSRHPLWAVLSALAAEPGPGPWACRHPRRVAPPLHQASA